MREDFAVMNIDVWCDCKLNWIKTPRRKRRIWLRATTASDGIIATARGYPITSFNMEVIGYAAIADDNKCWMTIKNKILKNKCLQFKLKNIVWIAYLTYYIFVFVYFFLTVLVHFVYIFTPCSYEAGVYYRVTQPHFGPNLFYAWWLNARSFLNQHLSFVGMACTSFKTNITTPVVRWRYYTAAKSSGFDLSLFSWPDRH